MAFDYINEAFKRLDILNEEMFDTSLNGINKLADFIEENDDTDEVIRVIDPEATTDDELQDSYVGKVIVNCNVCHSHIFENKEDIKIEEDGSVNVETHCPYCGEQEGFVIVGEIAPYGDAVEETESREDEPNDDVVPENDVSENSDNIEDVVTESYEPLDDRDMNVSPRMSRATRRVHHEDMQEDFKEVSITTEDQHLEMTSDENGKVTVTTEPVENVITTEETIVPVSDETETEILNNNEVDEPLDNEPVEDEFDFDFDEIDEEGFDDLGESYLRKVYENVESFKTTSVSANEHALVVEGLITFASGTQKKTGFIFEALDANSRGQLRFSGSNKHLAESTNAYSLVGRVDNKKLFVESLKYNYKVNEQSIRGLVRRK